MIGATKSHAPATWRRLAPALAGLGLAALTVTACGGAGATAAPPVAGGSSPAPASSQPAFPGVIGTAAAVSSSSLEVQNPANGQVTVTFTSSTAITDEVAATSRDVTVGSCVTVAGQSPAGGTASGSAARSVTATTVTVSTPVNGNCGGAGGFGGGVGFGGPRGTFSPNPSFSARPRPSGSRGAFGNGGFGGANGKVTSLSASGFVVQGREPRAGAGQGASASAGASAGASITVTVTTTATTKYLKVVTAKPSALKVGECIAAVGTANSIGAVAARTIRISQPGPDGCVTGFGRRGAAGSPSGAASNA